MNNFDYPVGSDTQDAPWNEQSQSEHEFSVTCSQSLSKDTTVFTDDFKEEWEDDYDGENHFYNMIPDTSDTNWKGAYKNNNHYTPLELIECLKVSSEESLKELKTELWEIRADGDLNKVKDLERRIHNLEILIEECTGWVEDETEIVEE